MTLGQMFRILFGESDSISCPPFFLDLELENFENQCYFAMYNYFKSEKFQKDIDSCKLDYDFSIQEGLIPFLHLERDKNGIFTITINPYCIGNDEDEI